METSIVIDPSFVNEDYFKCTNDAEEPGLIATSFLRLKKMQINEIEDHDHTLKNTNKSPPVKRTLVTTQ